MPSGFTRSPKLFKGALIKLTEELLRPVPNIIVFQYNPETMTRTLMSSNAGKGGGSESVTTAEPNDPTESFSLTLILDAADALEEPEKNPEAVISGIADRIAALEMLLYPAADNLIEGVISSLLGGKAVPRNSVPVTLFTWGPGRILPVRLTSFSVEEQAYSSTLYPIRASVSVGLQVLTEQSFNKHKLNTCEELALWTYKYTKTQKEALALSNVQNNVESILSMLPI